MKAEEGVSDLVIIICFMIACIPFLIMLITTLNYDTYEYLTDKSTTKRVTPYEYDENNMWAPPKNRTLINLDIGQALALGFVQDDYGAKYTTVEINRIDVPSMLIRYDYEYTDSTVPNNPANILYSFDVREGYRSTIEDILMGAMMFAGTNLHWEEYKDKPVYLVWNSVEHCWVITSKYCPVYD